MTTHALRLRPLGVAAAFPLFACATADPLRTDAPSALPPLEPGVVHYDASLRLDPMLGALDSRFRLTFLADERTADSVVFVLNRGLTIQEISGPAVRGHRVEPSPDWEGWTQAVVALDGTVSARDVVTMDVAYSGEPEFSADGIGGISAEWVELNLDAMWQPVLATFDKRMAGVLRVELPEQWDLVSSGTVTREGDAFVVRSTVLLSDVPFVAAPRLARFGAAGFEVYHRDDEEAAAAVLAAAEACASYLNREFGDARPLPPGRIVIADRPGGGYARTNYIVLNEVSADRRGLHHYLCHELAHFWTDSGDFRSAEHWMSEAFAEYVAARAIREAYGEEVFSGSIRRWEEAGRRHGPVWTPEATSRPSDMVMYRRAPVILNRLEQRIGADAFGRFLHRYMVEDVRTTRRLIEHLREIAGEEAAEWFTAELMREPDPEPAED